MTYPRRQIVDPDTPGFFHCVSRCVRRAFLCGQDGYSGKCFEHRRQWVEDSLFEISEIFAVGMYAYAVMSKQTRTPTFRVSGAACSSAWLGGMTKM